MSHGRYFLHEHPATDSSWKKEEMLGLMNHDKVDRVVGHMCVHGMTSTMADGTIALVKKPTGWLTNSPCINKYSKTNAAVAMSTLI